MSRVYVHHMTSASLYIYIYIYIYINRQNLEKVKLEFKIRIQFCVLRLNLNLCDDHFIINYPLKFVSYIHLSFLKPLCQVS